MNKEWLFLHEAIDLVKKEIDRKDIKEGMIGARIAELMDLNKYNWSKNSSTPHEASEQVILEFIHYFNMVQEYLSGEDSKNQDMLLKITKIIRKFLKENES